MYEKNFYTSKGTAKKSSFDYIFYRKVKEELRHREAVGLFFHDRDIYEGSLIFQRDYIKVFPIWIPGYDNRERYTGWYAAFDINKIKSNSSISLEVPKRAKELFGGKNKIIEEWCQKLGVKHIEVVVI